MYFPCPCPDPYPQSKNREAREASEGNAKRALEADGNS